MCESFNGIIFSSYCSSNTILGGYGILVQFYHSSKNNSKTVLVNKCVIYFIIVSLLFV